MTHRAALRTVVTASLTVVATLGPVVPVAVGVTADDVADLRGRVEALVDEHVGTTTPAAVVSVVGPDGPIVLDAWGLADPAAGTPITTDTRVPVASISKVVTSLTALTLHHEGLLDLDADVRASLPVRDERTVRTPVTGRHLLTHHSGLEESVLFHPEPNVEDDVVPLRDVLEEHPPTLRHPTDAGLHYSALQGYTMIGAAIESATGGSFDDAVAGWVLDPVGATDADFLGPDAGSAGHETGVGVGVGVGVGRDGPANDVAVLSTLRDGTWQPAPWPAVRERPAASLIWSARDAAALLTALVGGEGLPAAVVAEATTVAVRPTHGGGGHTQAFFEGRRADVPVLEHAGANGVGWLALVPGADLGVFAAVTTTDPAAAAFTSDVLDTVADWAADTGQVAREPAPAGGMETIVPPWAGPLEPAAPVGTFHQRLFVGQGPELALRTPTGQRTIRQVGDELHMGDRVLAPSATPGRWCDAAACVAGVRTPDGTVSLLLGDRAMLEQTLVPAPVWADLRLVGTTIALALLLTAVSLGGTVRAAWRRRRGRPVARAVSRPLALAWGALTVAVVVGTPLLVASPLLTGSVEWLPADGPGVWGLRALTVAHVAVGAGWMVTAIRRIRLLSGRRRLSLLPAVVVGLGTTAVLITWAVPG